MSVKIGTTNVEKIYLGTDEVQKIYIGTDLYYSSGRLPSVYQEVEWIGSSGTQWIDTDFKATSLNLKFEGKFSVPTNGNVNDWGFANTTSDNNWFNPYYNTSGTYAYYIGTSRALASAQRTSGDLLEVVVEANNSNAITIENNGDIVSTTFTGSFLVSNGNFLVFSSGMDSPSSRASATNFYYAKIWQDGALQRDLIPCYRKSDNEIGMYDLITETFFTNQGTGTFTKGPNV